MNLNCGAGNRVKLQAERTAVVISLCMGHVSLSARAGNTWQDNKDDAVPVRTLLLYLDYRPLEPVA